MSSVEVMEAPDKSENDKKSYRVIRLENGLKALLISDPTQERTSNETIEEAATASDNEVEEDDDDDGDGGDDDEMGDSESDNDESECESRRSKRGKLAACSLCVDVGSFSDPRDVQGLAHFLGKINNLLT